MSIILRFFGSLGGAENVFGYFTKVDLHALTSTYIYSTNSLMVLTIDKIVPPINESVVESVGVVTTVSWCQVSDGQLSTHYKYTASPFAVTPLNIHTEPGTGYRVTSDVNMCHQSDTATFCTIVHLTSAATGSVLL